MPKRQAETFSRLKYNEACTVPSRIVFILEECMLRFLASIALSCFLSGMSAAYAQSSLETSGTLVVVAAHGEVKAMNDEAIATFMIEEQDKDRAAAASRVNQKMKQGIAIIKRADAQAKLETRSYYTYPVYAEEEVQPLNRAKARELVGWRVGQYLEVVTGNIASLPATVASAQNVLALNGLQFRLNDATRKRLEEERIAAAYQDLNVRTMAIAKAMGRKVSDATLETLDFEGSGNYAPQQEAYAARTMSARSKSQQLVEEPSFEPGETTLSTRVVGKIRFR
jgi:uncharacterized protein YggE